MAEQVCTIKKVLTKASIVCDPPHWLWEVYGHDEAKYSKALQNWVTEFNDFIRDHRSKDVVHLAVQKEYRDVCSSCGYGYWEYVTVDEESGQESCSKCGALYFEIAKEPSNG